MGGNYKDKEIKFVLQSYTDDEDFETTSKVCIYVDDEYITEGYTLEEAVSNFDRTIF
ncbi:MAG: hypothetical protein IJA32_11055 [Lachnospiraceae bacterium]|nr:hypothetical protein [Lachnospiraceae bacterium]